MTIAEATAPQQRKRVVGRPFRPGQSGNPKGRPPGSRNRLNELFFSALTAAFEKHGARAIERAFIEDPVAAVRVLASLMPRDLHLDHTINVDVAEFGLKIREAIERINRVAPASPPRPTMKTINAKVMNGS